MTDPTSTARAPIDLVGLKLAYERATLGPWAYDVDDPDPLFQPNYTIYPEADCEHSIAEVNGQINKSGDACLIVAAVNALPALLSEIESLRAALAEVEARGLEKAAGLADTVANRPVEAPEHGVWERSERQTAKRLASQIRALKPLSSPNSDGDE